jgi:hypothetical protein
MKKTVTAVYSKDSKNYHLFLIEHKMPIPLIPATHSEGSRPAVPIESGHLFRFIPATLSERSDAGI